MVDRAIDWIGGQVRGKRPFFAQIATMSPHRPCVPPAEFQGRSAAGRRGDAVVMVDDLLGRILAALGPAAADTMIIFSSDNGAPMNYPEDGDTFRAPAERLLARAEGRRLGGRSPDPVDHRRAGRRRR